MMIFLELKEWLRSFYGKFAVLVNGLVKFGYTFFALLMLSRNLGYMTRLNSLPVIAVLSLACAFLPYGAVNFLIALAMLGHIYTVSMEIALVTGIFLVIVMLLYYGFQPRDSYWLVLVPAAFLLKVPFAVGLLAGLSGSLVTAIPVSCGVVIYYILQYVRLNAGVLTNDASVDITQKFVQIIRALCANHLMIVMVAVCAVGILVVFLIRTLSVDYAWVIAIIAGTIAQLAALFACSFLFDITVSIAELIIGALLSVLLAGLYHFFVFAVDYTRTEYTQFEDDDYVYYIKAVPKVTVSKSDVRVQRINKVNKNRR